MKATEHSAKMELKYKEATDNRYSNQKFRNDNIEVVDTVYFLGLSIVKDQRSKIFRSWDVSKLIKIRIKQAIVFL